MCIAAMKPMMRRITPRIIKGAPDTSPPPGRGGSRGTNAGWLFTF
jgi:hypothetical protein